LSCSSRNDTDTTLASMLHGNYGPWTYKRVSG
jgi:hypothetical protein